MFSLSNFRLDFFYYLCRGRFFLFCFFLFQRTIKSGNEKGLGKQTNANKELILTSLAYVVEYGVVDS